MDASKGSTFTRTLPQHPELQRIKKQAKLLLKRLRDRDDEAIAEVNAHYRQANLATFRLSDAQLVIARSYGFSSWPKLASRVQALQSPTEWDPLHYKDVFQAVKVGEIDKVLSFIDEDESAVDIADNNQSTPLTVAFAYKRFELVRLLIERGANVFAMNHSDKWGLRYIVEKQGLERRNRQRLIETAIAAHVWDGELFHAVWRRDQQQAKAILASDLTQVSLRLADPEGPDGFYNTLPYCGLTPLHYAVIAGDEPMVRLLLESGAEVDALPHAHPPDSRHTPIYYVPDGCGAIAELLVSHGADVNHSTLYLSEGSKAMQEVIVAKGAGGTPLMAALSLGELDKAAELVGNDPSVVNDRLPEARIDTPLHMAVQSGSVEIVDLLLGQGMDIDTTTSRGFTALAMAPEMYSSFEMIKFLVERGADIHVGNDSPLYAAVWQQAYGHWDYESVIRYLAGLGSRPRGLCDCARGGNLSLTKLLLELGAEVNETDEFGFYAPIPSSAGYTALDYSTGLAGDHEHPDITALLREHGAKHSADLVD